MNVADDDNTEAADGHSNSYFLFLPRTLAHLKIPINDPVNEFNYFNFWHVWHSRLFLLLNKTRRASTTSRLLESSASEMFPVGLGP